MQIKNTLIQFASKLQSGNMEKDFPLPYCIPVYHTVSNEDLPHIKHIIAYKKTKQFEQDLDFLSKNFEWVNWTEFKDFQKGIHKPKKKIALLTFDDGLREFKEIIAPILEQKGIFAINFINPAFIDNQQMMFRNKASLLVERVMISKKINPVVYQLSGIDSENKTLLIQKILQTNYKKRSYLDEISTHLEVDFDQYLQEKNPYLNIEELHALRKKGFEFGAHSINHPYFAELTTEEQLSEAQQSLKYLWKNTLQHETFAFPFTDFGVENAFFQKLFAEEKDLFCTFGAAGIKKDCVEKNFQRIPMETNNTAEEILKKEMAYFQLKKLVNKNTIIRK